MLASWHIAHFVVRSMCFKNYYFLLLDSIKMYRPTSVVHLPDYGEFAQLRQSVADNK